MPHCELRCPARCTQPRSGHHEHGAHQLERRSSSLHHAIRFCFHRSHLHRKRPTRHRHRACAAWHVARRARTSSLFRGLTRRSGCLERGRHGAITCFCRLLAMLHILCRSRRQARRMAAHAVHLRRRWQVKKHIHRQRAKRVLQTRPLQHDGKQQTPRQQHGRDSSHIPHPLSRDRQRKLLNRRHHAATRARGTARRATFQEGKHRTARRPSPAGHSSFHC
mmetsp:Transcript_29660/g.96986  ORF Transcript_29660/g.96986 Transcript_29660/m.96986 type:complete len:221 (-) Transcript_29660:1259-1921(-)